MTTLFFEAALRSLLMAGTVWAGIRLLRISNVFAQKTAWSLVLLASIAMPFLARSVPARRWSIFLPPISFLLRSRRSRRPPGCPTTSPPPRPWSASCRRLRTLRAGRCRSSSTLVIPSSFAASSSLWLRLLIGLIIAARIWYRAQRASPILEPRATVRISSAIGSPVTIGSGIVLPDSYPEWNLAKLRMVLAHERSHVRQADFYLQLLAAVYTAIFWFSPVGWWLQRKLADLGEAISDRAALEEAANRDSYAEVLLEFARMPRRSLAGVHMARSSNLHRRIDRLLTDQQFRLAFIAVRRHVLIALAIVPLALLAATSLIGVKAAEAGRAQLRFTHPCCGQLLLRPLCLHCRAASSPPQAPATGCARQLRLPPMLRTSRNLQKLPALRKPPNRRMSPLNPRRLPNRLHPMPAPARTSTTETPKTAATPTPSSTVTTRSPSADPMNFKKALRKQSGSTTLLSSGSNTTASPM
jgi:hypothetical protein